MWKESQLPAKALGLELHSLPISAIDNLETGVKDAIKAHSGALAITGGALIANITNQVIDLTAKSRLPAIYNRPDDVANGGLMSYGLDGIEPYRRAAVLVDKILKGAKPADLPVEQPTKFAFLINLKTAKQIGLTIPPNVLARADRVIK